MFNEFKKFIARGNVLEMAVGLIMALYFGGIVKSLVDDIIMPPIGLILGGIDFSQLKVVIQKAVPAVIDGTGQVLSTEVAEVAINYGNFINTIITFLIVAFAVFLLLKGYNNLRKKEEVKPAAPPAPTKEEILLTEIRDLLKR
jgi:large conductance mechanosensitive channel